MVAATKRCQQAIQEIRDLRRRTCLHELTFVDLPVPMTGPQKKALEQTFRKSFERWWDTWIEPQLKIVEKG